MDTFTKKQMQFRMGVAAIGGIFVSLAVSYAVIKLNDPETFELAPKVDGNVSVEKGMKSLKAYRKTGAMTSLSLLHAKHKLGGIVHDSTSIEKIYKDYLEFKDTHSHYDGFEWGLGLYPSLVKSIKANLKKEDGEKPSDKDSVSRLCIYFIPTMLGKTKDAKRDSVLDYFSYSESPYYTQTKPLLNPSGGSPINDQGTIFP